MEPEDKGQSIPAHGISPGSGVPTPGTICAAPEVVTRVFSIASLASRACVLQYLLGSVGTLALAVIGGGAFSKFCVRASALSLEDAARVSSSQIFELATYVQQSNASVIDQALAVLAQDGSTTGAVGASLAAIAISKLSPRRDRLDEGPST